MEIHEALQEYFKRKNISQVSIAEALNVSKAYVNALLSGRQRFGKKQAEIWSEKFGLSKSWLLTGEGEMLKKQEMYNEVEDVMPEERELIERGLRDGAFRLVPLIPSNAFGGPIARYLDEGVTDNDCSRILSPVSAADMAIPVSGDSMEPVIHDNSVLYIARINDRAFIPWGNIMVVDTENGALVKAIYPVEGDDSVVQARSVNPVYPPFNIPKSSIRGIYRILSITKFNTTM